MLKSVVDLSPGGEPDIECRLDQIKWFWQCLRAGENSGETTWEELENLQTEVANALAQNPSDVSQAETLTAYALLLMTGAHDL